MTLTVHHLHQSSSERVVWLCEELGIPYTLKEYHRAPLLAPPEYKALHPSGTSPVIHDSGSGDNNQDGTKEITLAESGACIEYICHRYGGGAKSLYLPPTHPRYADFLYWWYWSNATFVPSLGRAMFLGLSGLEAEEGEGTEEEKSPAVSITRDRLRNGLANMDRYLGENEWLAGDEFSAADVMAVFPLTTMRYFWPYSLRAYGNVVEYLGRVGARPAYRAAMARCEPGMAPALGADPPSRKDA